ncbi:MAG: hypothetical protein L6V81_09390 [Clostridium sp.]|nr:MAG: hypothetical protein L6V81_09390 [Clostridium sp.]
MKKHLKKPFMIYLLKIIYLTGETLAIQIYHYYKLGLITIEDLQELIRLINNNEHLESLNLIFKSIPTTEDIRESIIYIRNELLKKIVKKTIKLQKNSFFLI